MELVIQIQLWDEAVYVLLHTNAFEIGINGKIVGQTGFFSLGSEPFEKKE